METNELFEKRIRELEGYPDGWKGEDSKGGSNEIFRLARILLTKLRLVNCSPTAIGLYDDGDFALTWMDRENGLYGSGTIYEDGEWSYYVKSPKGHEANDCSMVESDPIPEDVVNLILQAKGETK